MHYKHIQILQQNYQIVTIIVIPRFYELFNVTEIKFLPGSLHRNPGHGSLGI